MTRSFKNTLLRAVVIVTVWSCAMPVGEKSDAGATHSVQALTAGDHGLELMLPFSAGTSRTLTRGYMGDISDCVPPEGEQRKTSHCTYASGLWDDQLALDFSGDGCSSWRAPVLAAAEGRVVIPPDSGGRRARSYGEAEVVIDHGNGCMSHYAHLDERMVTEGQFVRQGEAVGFEGNRGNVSGSACPEHPGTHLHFKVVCNGVAVKPEPISGYVNLAGHVGRKFEHRALHHPVGTLIKTRHDPRIYRVCSADSLCHVTDERIWRSRRFFQDARDEWATVIVVGDDEIACHELGPPISTVARMVATTCGSATYVTYEDGGEKWRRKVNFAPSQAGYRILLKSWGFRLDEVVANDASCSTQVDALRPHLALRDGTVIEESSDNDFFIIADDGTAYRVFRNLMPVLYGGAWPQTIQVPTGSVPQLVRTVAHEHPEFTVTDATTCPNGSLMLEPSIAGAFGGGTDGIEQLETVVESEDCENPMEAANPIPEESDAAALTDGTITCVKTGSEVDIFITGPVMKLVVGDAPHAPVAIKYGSDRDGWTDFAYGAESSKRQIAWPGDEEAGGGRATYQISLPSDSGRFNFYLYGSSGEVGWFDLPDADGDGDAWKIQGDCQMACDSQSCALSF